jgi:hypothetical protein
MRLLSFRSKQEESCLVLGRLFISNKRHNQHLFTGVQKQSQKIYWTSGANESAKNVWCTFQGTTKDTISMDTALNWLQNTSLSPEVEKCTVIEINPGDASKSGLRYSNCATSHLFICEVKRFQQFLKMQIFEAFIILIIYLKF